MKSILHFKPVADVFRSTSEEAKAMHVQVARLSVLYEDLQIEWSGTEQEELKPLDRTDVTTRRFYFVRRTLATLTEIEQAIHKLNSNRDFQTIRRWMKSHELRAWDDAVKFFSVGHAFLNDWRNDVGGHFLDGAASYAIDNVHPSTIGVIEVYRRGDGADVKMPFAYELVAVAMTKNKGTKTEEVFLKTAFIFLKDAVAHAIDAVQIVTHCYLLDRFK